MRRAILLVTWLALASCSSHATRAPEPEPGTLSGVVIVQDQDGRNASPLSGIEVGAYKEAIPIGGPVPSPLPAPVATARTGADGVFRFWELAAGRWFLVPTGGPGWAPGEWVRYQPATGASVTLHMCRNCPVPA